jgi:glycosyltransferase involved in cell wall biosynthesis
VSADSEQTVHVLLPDSVDDPTRPSGGNTYDHRVCAGLESLGWSVRVHALPGSWPHPDATSLAALARELDSLPRGALVLVDGLVASGTPDVVVPEAARLRVVVLVHLPLGHPLAGEAGRTGQGAARTDPAEGERLVLESAAAVLTTSRWTSEWLAVRYLLHPDRLHVAQPGADLAQPTKGTPSGAALLTVAAVVPAKGHLELVSALASLRDLPWHLVCAGALDLTPDHVARVRRQCLDSGIAERVSFTGPLAGADVEEMYAAADLLVVASRIETYGLVITEALAHALPVVATSVGGVPEAMGGASASGLPGLLVPATGPQDLGRALRSWLEDAGLRGRLRAAAAERRTTLLPWSATAQRVSEVLAEVAA